MKKNLLVLIIFLILVGGYLLIEMCCSYGCEFNECNFKECIFEPIKWIVLERKKINKDSLPIYKKPNQIENSISLCEKIKDNHLRYECLAIIKNDISFCYEVESDYGKIECYEKIKGNQLTLQKCKELKGLNERNQCYEIWGNQEGLSFLELKNSGILEKEYYQDWIPLYKEPIPKDIQDIKLCDKMEDECQRINCFTQVAINLKDVFICNKIKEEDKCFSGGPMSKKYCFVEVVKIVKDPQICEEIPYSERDLGVPNNECYLIMAKATNDFSFCEKMKKFNGASFEIECYEYFAVTKKDESFCEKIDYKPARENCYFKTAKNKKDESLCKKISEKCLQGECIAAFENPHACEFCPAKGCCGSPFPKKECYFNSALSLRDPTLCKYSHNEDYCLYKLALIFSGWKSGELNYTHKD